MLVNTQKLKHTSYITLNHNSLVASNFEIKKIEVKDEEFDYLYRGG